jgi:alkanesulfonate monooxygenase SsuD/methylene tetrahydromethanopterin reductase-like flavin-dependent oxidoreductase (luciferase family)
VKVIRLVIEGGWSGQLGKWEGEYYKLDLDRFKTLAPPVRPTIPIYIPALYEIATRVAGEIADGLPSHPIWAEKWILSKVEPNLKIGLDKAGRKRSDFDLNIWQWVAPAATKKQAIADARATVIFYALHKQYDRYFTECGFGPQAKAIAEASDRHDQAAMVKNCPDEMVETFAVVGTPDECRARIDRIAGVADSFTLSPAEIGEYSARIAQTFYL